MARCPTCGSKVKDGGMQHRGPNKRARPLWDTREVIPNWRPIPNWRERWAVEILGHKPVPL